MGKKSDKKADPKPARVDRTEPRWTCSNGHSNPATFGRCGMCGSQ